MVRLEEYEGGRKFRSVDCIGREVQRELDILRNVVEELRAIRKRAEHLQRQINRLYAQRLGARQEAEAARCDCGFDPCSL